MYNVNLVTPTLQAVEISPLPITFTCYIENASRVNILLRYREVMSTKVDGNISLVDKLYQLYAGVLDLYGSVPMKVNVYGQTNVFVKIILKGKTLDVALEQVGKLTLWDLSNYCE